MSTTLPPCDCLNYCGDDPRLQEGRVQACAASVALAAKRARNLERERLGVDLAKRFALEVVRTAGEQVLLNGHIHFKTVLPKSHRDATDLAQAARYLLLADLATPHPTRANLLRINKEA